MATTEFFGTEADEKGARGAGALSPRFDAAHYLAANPDLDLTPDAAADHYARIGRAEGRVASPLALRENLLKLIDDGRSVLEIGPFCNPLLRGPNIAYLDVLDADQLRARAVKTGADPAGCPAWIDYVGGLEQVRRRFDAVVSSHAIEHQTDLIQHLEQVERILAPDGLFCLIVPDKRYCFDHYLAETTIAGVIQAHRDERRLHNITSVIEHGALTTHNDSRRHWAGDHGPAVPVDRSERVRQCMADFDANVGSYIDVHAWYFTPDSFATIIDNLGALGLTGLELAGVYDTAHNRNEFCAVLRLGAAARQRARHPAAGGDIVVLQTADADRYAPMLAVTAQNVREYCRRHGLGYESFVGIRRGFHPWQATFNRIPMLVDLVAQGFTGWALYLDADAYIQDLDFDLAAYLADKRDRAAIFATSGVTGEAWDVNAGVALINLGHPLGRELVAQWAAGFAAHSDEDLRAGEEWFGAGNDQDLLHTILRKNAAIGAAVLVEQMSFMNGPHARFIRQQLRTLSPSFDERLKALTASVADIFRRDGRVALPLPADDRWASRLQHRAALQCALVEAAIPAPRPDLVSATSVTALGETDAVAAAATLAALGRAEIAEGHLGGPRQHRRAADPVFADRLARWTYDKLVSLAEAVGVLPLENPETGRWGVNALTDPARLFAEIGAALDADLRPPSHIGGYLGIDGGAGTIVHMRMLDAIHAAWRLRQIAELTGLGRAARIAEIDGGVGLTAFYARRLGLKTYSLFDRPALNAVQAYLLADWNDARTLPTDAFAALAPGSVDILFSGDSQPGEHLADMRRIGVRHLLSINQEGGAPDQPTMLELMRETGGYRLVSRHRHWLRAGYAEEYYIESGAI